MFIGPAKEAMQWFKRLGNLAGKHQIKLKWTNPAGLPITQGYLDMKGTVITLRYLTNVSLRFTAGLEEKGLDPRRMGTGLSPNVIHSLDASHMAFTTLDAFAKGITNLGGIHDCFATTPAEMTVLRDCVRNTFADLYSRDVLTDIVNQLISQLPFDVAADAMPSPELGTLNPNTVRHSTYFIT
jgi:DNA-directed RNA polymerase